VKVSVVVVGSANLDLVYRVERIPGPGETVLAIGYESNPGGKGNNQVIAVARAGAPVAFVAALGRDSAADEIVASLDASGVTQLVRRVDAPTGTALITVDQTAENTIVVSSGANAMLRDLDADERAAIEQADLLLLQLETPLETVIEAAAVAREAGTTVVLNAAPIQSLPTDLLESLDLLIVNEHEAAHLARGVHPGIEIPEILHTADAAHIADVLTGLGVAVIVTLGAEGALVAVPGEPAAHVPGIRVKAVDTTGAGDTFCGALLAALDARLHEGGDRRSRPELDALVRAAEFATAAAALSVQHVGAVPSIPSLTEIEAFRAES
jgi:ribokinase